MAVLRVVANLSAAEPATVAKFYQDLLGLDVVMDHGWIVTLANDTKMRTQFSIASEGGSGTPVPNISVEVDNVADVFSRAVKAGCEIAYAITDEPWGVRRFYLRDPAGNLVNILQHL